MSRQFTRQGRILAFSVALGALLAIGTACEPGPYGACTLPSSEALNEACSSQGGGENTSGESIDTSATCVIDFVFECESQLCGTYKGSDAFCTERCDPAAPTCPENGVCLEWVPGLGEFYCVPQDEATR